MMISGGAPLSPDTHVQIKVCLCIDVVQGYGLTETTASACVTDRYDMSLGRCGAPSMMVDVRLINWDEGKYRVTDKPYPRGEIVVGGETVSKGYFKLPGKTEEDFFEENGRRWFKTGDIGEFHPDGVLKIIGEFYFPFHYHLFHFPFHSRLFHTPFHSHLLHFPFHFKLLHFPFYFNLFHFPFGFKLFHFPFHFF